MRPTTRGQPLCGRHRQRGQALIYGMFMLVASLTGLFFLFNTGQLASEKTKLVNTADAVAYSAAVMHARALNFDAYNNRALVANEVLVAQMVSLSSWAQYAKLHVERVPQVFPECFNVYTAAAAAAFYYDPIYGAMCYAIVQPGNPVVAAVEELGTLVPPATQTVVSLVELNKSAIQAASEFLHAGTYFKSNRNTVMQEVADRNYLGDGQVTVLAVNAPGAGGGAMADAWNGFTKKYAEDERTRIAEVATRAAADQKFVAQRRWDAKAILPVLIPSCFGRFNRVQRRGGTELIGLEEWKAEDTESYWHWRASGFFRLGCSKDETPIAWGEQRAFPGDKEQDASGAQLGGSPADNPSAHANASSTEWNNYSGMPAFYDLTPAIQAGPDDPRLRFAVKLVRDAAQLRTSSGSSQIGASPRLNNFVANPAGGVMTAIATGEVYFERPWFNTGDHSYSTGDTAYVVTQNQAKSNTNVKSRELGSLFNPYWQVHLVANDAALLASEQGAQGAVMPP